MVSFYYVVNSGQRRLYVSLSVACFHGLYHGTTDYNCAGLMICDVCGFFECTDNSLDAVIYIHECETQRAKGKGLCSVRLCSMKIFHKYIAIFCKIKLCACML